MRISETTCLDVAWLVDLQGMRTDGKRLRGSKGLQGDRWVPADPHSKVRTVLIKDFKEFDAPSIVHTFDEDSLLHVPDNCFSCWDLLGGPVLRACRYQVRANSIQSMRGSDGMAEPLRHAFVQASFGTRPAWAPRHLKNKSASEPKNSSFLPQILGHAFSPNAETVSGRPHLLSQTWRQFLFCSTMSLQSEGHACQPAVRARHLFPEMLGQPQERGHPFLPRITDCPTESHPVSPQLRPHLASHG